MEKLLEQVVVFHGYFSPLKFGKYTFIDGGILNNVPVDEVRMQGADCVIAVKFHSEEVEKSSNVMDIVMKSIDIMGNKISEENISRSDLVLDVYTDKTGLLDIEKLDKCYKFGYDCAMENMDKIRKLIGKN